VVTATADIPAGDGERRHDPLCPAPLCDWTGEAGNDCMGYEDCHHLCQCDLIARVREDERAAALRDAIAAVKSREEGDYFPWVQVLIATAAIQDLQP
jgi:hypothetical protein